MVHTLTGQTPTWRRPGNHAIGDLALHGNDVADVGDSIPPLRVEGAGLQPLASQYEVGATGLRDSWRSLRRLAECYCAGHGAARHRAVGLWRRAAAGRRRRDWRGTRRWCSFVKVTHLPPSGVRPVRLSDREMPSGWQAKWWRIQAALSLSLGDERRKGGRRRESLGKLMAASSVIFASTRN